MSFYGSHTEETKRKMSKSRLGKKHTREAKDRISKSLTGHIVAEETKRKISKSLSGKNHFFYGKHHTRATKKKFKRFWNDSKNKTYMAELSKNRWNDPEYQFKMGMILNSPAYRKKRRKIWKDPNYQEKMRKSCSLKPNRSEKSLDELLKKLTFGDYKYVGNFSVFFGSKNPDFININGQKKLIELAGDYWHDESYPKRRRKHFRKYGFDTLVIWESELKKSIEEVTNKILLFNYLDINSV